MVKKKNKIKRSHKEVPLKFSRIGSFNDLNQKGPFEDENVHTRFPTSEEAPYSTPEGQGEQDAVGGSMPDTQTDDNTLDMAKRAGFQTEEDEEHPKPVDAGRDINKAEEYKRTH